MMYSVHRAQETPSLNGDWQSPVWHAASVLEVSHFRPESSDHRPVTKVKVLYDEEALHVIFRVADRYVRSVQTDYQAPVCTDSCVEWFAQPRPDKGYINFEVNAGGALLCSYIEDPTRTPVGFKQFELLPSALGQQVSIVHSLPAVIDPEITQPVDWVVQLRVPLTLFEHYIGKLGALQGQRWQANFYKCGDQTSHPHWAAWSPVQALNFHQPRDFAPILFV
jgi:hypothetical protein